LRLSNRGHWSILRAVKARRPDLAQKAMTRHIQTTLAVWLGLQSGMAHNGDVRAAASTSLHRGGTGVHRRGSSEGAGGA
jgi:hypothetical protein